MLSQLSQNPDLTRLSLPAVFQYPYSALELGAYRGLRFANKILSVADVEDAIERISMVTGWAMTSSENEEFNKKPYNPVLGEELTAWTEDEENGKTVFKAEQVEHHPPISAFVMRNEKKDLTFACNVEFGVQFHGNSVTVSTQGFGELKFGNGEVYCISKYIPDLKIENVVFGTKRQRWAGQWEVTCEKSGLGVCLNFSETKQNGGWFGTTSFVNDVTGFVWKLTDSERTPVATISGLAGEKLVLQRPKKPDLTVLDFDTLTTQKMLFLPPNLRPPNDSLRTWEDVTKAIVKDDLKKADQAKSRIEDHHRKLKKQMEHNEESYKRKYFFFDEKLERWCHHDNVFEDVALTAANITSIDDTDMESQSQTTRTELTTAWSDSDE